MDQARKNEVLTILSAGQWIKRRGDPEGERFIALATAELLAAGVGRMEIGTFLRERDEAYQFFERYGVSPRHAAGLDNEAQPVRIGPAGIRARTDKH